MNRWITKTIGELCDESGGKVQTGPFGSQLHESDYSEMGTPVVMPKDICNGRIDDSSIARVSDLHVDRLHKHKLTKGDIIFGRRGEIGRQALIREENTGWLCGTGCLRISLNGSSVISEFLYNYLQLPEIIQWVEGQAVGATMMNLNTSILRRLPVTYPQSRGIQYKIAAILSAYDELIENNKRRIELLEKMANEIYSEWFMRMRFPGHAKPKITKGLPKGWNIFKLPDVAKISYGFPFQSSRFNTTGIGKPIIRIRNIPDSSTEDYTDEQVADKYLVSKGELVVGMDGEFHINHWYGEEAYLVQRVCRIAVKDEKLKGYISLAIRAPIKHFESILMGATVGHLGAKHLNSIEIRLPPENQRDVLCIFNQLFDQKKILSLQTRLLKRQRDLLLSRLISGKLSVENLDIQFPPRMAKEMKEEIAELKHA